MDDAAAGLLGALDFLRGERLLQEVNGLLGCFGMQLDRDRQQAFRDVLAWAAFFVGADVPVIAVGVADRGVAIAVGLVGGGAEAGGSGFDCALVGGVDVGNIDVESRGRRGSTPGSAAADHEDGLANANLAVNAAGAAGGAEVLLRAEYVLDEVDQFGRFVDDEIGSDGAETRTDWVDSLLGLLGGCRLLDIVDALGFFVRQGFGSHGNAPLQIGFETGLEIGAGQIGRSAARYASEGMAFGMRAVLPGCERSACTASSSCSNGLRLAMSGA
jgi:hypothetical protein